MSFATLSLERETEGVYLSDRGIEVHNDSLLKVAASY